MQFGNWTFNQTTATLDHAEVDYQIPLWELNDSAHTLDWIFQIEEKSWATSADIGNLVKAIVEIFGRGMAGSGIDRPISAKKILHDKFGIKLPA